MASNFSLCSTWMGLLALSSISLRAISNAREPAQAAIAPPNKAHVRKLGKDGSLAVVSPVGAGTSLRAEIPG